MNEKTVREWLKYADEDFKGGKLLFENNQEEFKTLVCFHMQQTVEKYLKAYLVSNNIEIDRANKNKIHDIGKLIEKCKEIDEDFNSLYNIEPDRLTEYGVDLKYPFPFKVPTLEDERTAISIAEQVRPFVIKKINELSPTIDQDHNIKNDLTIAEKEPVQNKPNIVHSGTIKRKFRR